MAKAGKRSDGDPGLFLKHFSAGKEAYDAGRTEEAERQLEEAYLLRPRDQKVLNLLGLLYFKQEKFEKAEEVYRKLATESPEAHTLFYNLGLIYLKLNRFDDAELAFLKSLQLSRDNPKINFYLGSIYERQRRFQDAIFQYRQAGANIMVRRVENKLGPPPKRPAKGGKDDTAEFRGPQLPPKPETAPFLSPKPLQPVSDVLLSDAPRAREPQAAGAETRPPLPASPKTLPPSSKTLPPGRSSDIVAFLAGLPTGPPKEKTGVTATGITGALAAAAGSTISAAQPRSGERFKLLQRNLMEVSFAGKVFVKQGTIYSYTGNLTFWVKEKRPGANPSLVIVSGTGKLLLTDRDREITISSADSGLYVQPSALLACEEGLTPRYVRLGDDDGPEFLLLEGRGLIALSVATRPLTLAVTPGQPVAVAAHSVIMWAGVLEPTLVKDQALNEALLAPGATAPTLMQLEGTGRVLMEQAL
jgi:uncharacterized protein (AIM24 family)